MNELKFVMTCGACPEQYDVYLNDEKVAYVRLRWGVLSVSYPDVRGDIIYEHDFNEEFKGGFGVGEREKYFEIIKKKIIERLNE